MNGSEPLLLFVLSAGFGVLVWWPWRGRRRRNYRLPGRTWSPESPSQERERVLFVCTHNSARSQMAEALLRAMAADRFEVASAGTTHEASTRWPCAVMAEIGIDIAGRRAKGFGDTGDRWTYAITVCDAANERCPEFPVKTSRLHWSLPDPAAVPGTEQERLAAFRQVRDDLRRRIDQWVEERRVR